MNYQEEWKRKTITVEEAVGKINSGDYVYTYGCAAEPWTFLEHFRLLKGCRENVTLVDFLSSRAFDFYSDPSYQGVLSCESLFFSRFQGASQKAGLLAYAPVHLRNSGKDRLVYHSRTGKPLNIYVINGTPMDKHGYISTGIVAMSNRALAQAADLVMVEINENIPRTFGDSYLHISEVDYVFPGRNEVAVLPDRPVSEEDRVIGHYIAELIPDRATLQLGIGGIPNAVAEALLDKHDLGVHTEMLNDGLVKLYQAGAVTNRYKTDFPGRMVTTFTFGSQATYDFIDDNVGVLHLDVARTNAPELIARNDNMVSINTTMQVDLMGQCASEAMGTVQFSGSGGQVDFVLGSRQSLGGKSIIALHATAMVKDKDGNRNQMSTILPVHPAGTVITLNRTDIDYVVTEFGVAPLRGCTLPERARALISIAHPDYREELRQAAAQYYLL